MPVERVDANIASALSPDVATAVAENRAKTEENIGETDREASARKAAEKRITQKRATIQKSDFRHRIAEQDAATKQRVQQIMGGSEGPDAARALSSFTNNKDLQQKLTDAQKNAFFDAMAASPKQATAAGSALDRLTQQPGFHRAITNTQQTGTLQEGVLKAPMATEETAASMLASRFFQSSKADPQAKNQCLRFGLRQAAEGKATVAKQATDVLGSLVSAQVPRGAQRSVMRMVERTAGNPTATTNVDSYVKNANVRAMPSFARGKSVELLAVTNAATEVKEGFEKLAGNKRFKAQTGQNQGRFFTTIGSGRPSEYRAVTDHLLIALRSSDFPAREAQVGRLLNKMSAQVKKSGADAVDTGGLLREARKSAFPTPPKMLSTEGLSEEDALRVRAQNRGAILSFFNQLERIYERADKTLKSAKYLEDVNSLQTLREPPDLDTSALTPEELAIYEARRSAVGKRRAAILQVQSRRTRELRYKRMPPAERRARAAEKRSVGRQPRFIRPEASRGSASQAFVGLASGTDGQPAMPAQMRPLRGGTPYRGDVEEHVTSALSSLGDGPMTPDKVAHVARAIGQQVAREVVEQVTAQLLGTHAPAPPAHDSEPAVASAPRRAVITSDWRVPRVDRDLGGPHAAVVKTPREAPSAEAAGAAKYTGRKLLKDDASTRTLDELLLGNQSWSELAMAEQVLLRNLGWNGRLWAARDGERAQWPSEMGRTYAELGVIGQGVSAKQDAVRRLGFSAAEWDKRVQALKMGKNA